MLFMEFSRTCEKLEGISGRLEMIDIISRVLPDLSDEELPVFVRFVMGRIFPDWSSRKLGIGPNLLYEAIGYMAGMKKEQVVEKINRTGDVGQAVEELLSLKSQTTFFHEDLDIVRVYHELISIAEEEGKKSQREKLLAVRRLLGNAHPLEGRYLPGSCWRAPHRCRGGKRSGSHRKSLQRRPGSCRACHAGPQ